MITKTPEETRKFGKKLAEKIKTGGIVCLNGDLGAGKTTLVQGMADGLGLKKRINSPTFIIVRKYDNFWHIDLYRINDVTNLGLDEVLEDSNNIVIIEWPEKIAKLLPKHYIDINIKILNDKEREINEIIH